MDDVASHVPWALLCTRQYSGGWRHIRELAGHGPCLCSWLTYRAARKAANKGRGLLMGAKCCGPYIKRRGSGWASRKVLTLKDWLALRVGWAYSSQEEILGREYQCRGPETALECWGNIKSLRKERIEEEEDRRT